MPCPARVYLKLGGICSRSTFRISALLFQDFESIGFYIYFSINI
jgi:hypothetical protein